MAIGICSFQAIKTTETDGWHLAGALVDENADNSLTLVADTLYAVPFCLPAGLRVVDLRFNVKTAVAASSARMGIYAALGARPLILPGTLLLDSGTVATTTTGLKTFTVSLPVQRRLYHMVLHASHAIAVSAILDTSTGNTMYSFYGYNPISNAAQRIMKASRTFSSGLPATFPTVFNLTVGADVPNLEYRLDI